jgi:hypothetical protein
VDLLALLGFLVLLAGMHLAWQARQTILYWVSFAIATWRSALRPEPARRGGQSRPEPAPRPRELRNLRLLGGVSLIFLGQLLLVLALVF